MATIKQKRAVGKLVENGGNVSKSMVEGGYSEKTAKTPKKLTESKGFIELMDKNGLSDTLLAKKHKELLNATKIEHMVFPKSVTDEDIKALLESVNCKVRKIQHGDTANHCWFWARDNNALKNGLDLAYKLKGLYKENPENPITPTNLTQNNYYGTDLTKDFGDYLKEKTKATIKVSEVK